ncbi:MAG: outer membrane protein assembly factor BamD [Prevotella sp.]|nr:outer membrane protein assembly factor BamD [Prevotella sp.]
MKKCIIILSCLTLLMGSCSSEFASVYKYGDTEAKYEAAKEFFARGKFQQASDLLEDIVTIKKGSDEAQECLYMLAMAQYCNADYEAASETFKKYGSSYPRGLYAEHAAFYVGESLYESSPEPRLDQSPTNGAINAYQQFMDLYPDSKLRPRAQERLYELYDKLIQKEYISAELYYNLGGYFGNINSNDESNYNASIITAQNALKTYPYCSLREDFMLLIMKSKFQLAENSTEERRLERYRDAEDECYGFINEFPDSKNVSTAEKYIAKCKKVIKD